MFRIVSINIHTSPAMIVRILLYQHADNASCPGYRPIEGIIMPHITNNLKTEQKLNKRFMIFHTILLFLILAIIPS